ncbi:MAG: ABC transporter substrate-binding protein [Acidobacteria bacterium]|nr:ABC transporter substrate-binding protein [Acidobacteriota bacterium]
MPILFVLLGLLTACSPARLSRPAGPAAGAFLAGHDYFPAKAEVRHATQFRVRYRGHYKVVDFDPTVPTRERIQYLLVQRGAPVPPGFPGAQVIRIPITRYTHLHPAWYGLIERFGLVDQLVGISSINGVTVKSVLERYETGRIHAAGSGAHSNIELAIGLEPEAIFLFYSAYPEYNIHPKLRELGVPAIQLADQFEPTPLGRAEWIKFFSLFFNREEIANREFDAIASRYESLSRRANAAQPRPRVMGGAPSSDNWLLFGGRNFQARLIHDAGADYFWPGADHHSLITANFELVFDRSLDTSHWLTASGMFYPSIDGLIARDRRLAWFRPVAEHRVYAFDRNADHLRRIPYSNQSLDKPDDLLADLVAAFHPQLLPHHRYQFLRDVREAHR